MGLVGSCEALLKSLWVWFSLFRAGGAMPDGNGKFPWSGFQATGKNLQSLIANDMSNLFVCALRHHMGEANSAVLYTKMRAPVLRVDRLAPHARQCMLFLEDP